MYAQHVNAGPRRYVDSRRKLFARAIDDAPLSISLPKDSRRSSPRTPRSRASGAQNYRRFSISFLFSFKRKISLLTYTRSILKIFCSRYVTYLTERLLGVYIPGRNRLDGIVKLLFADTSRLLSTASNEGYRLVNTT